MKTGLKKPKKFGKMPRMTGMKRMMKADLGFFGHYEPSAYSGRPIEHAPQPFGK